ncbi:MAG: type II 3-dehydroquinate dehydratase [Elusimicrobiota bacterium]
MNILVINGPSLNLLGERNRKIYGCLTLPEINEMIRKAGRGHTFRFFQKNGEGELIDILQKNRKWADWLIINPGAYAHYSYALRDAIEACALRAIEVHISDISRREPFRRKSVLKPVCEKQIKGFGHESYLKALNFCIKNGKRKN